MSTEVIGATVAIPTSAAASRAGQSPASGPSHAKQSGHFRRVILSSPESPNSSAWDTHQAGGALLTPATLLKFHKSLVDRKYNLLFSSSSHRCKPGPKGPSAEVIAAIVELKSRNPKFGGVRIAQQICHTFGVDIDKDVVRRVLAKHYCPGHSGSSGPFWLTVIGHAKDSLWSADLFRVESILLRSH